MKKTQVVFLGLQTTNWGLLLKKGGKGGNSCSLSSILINLTNCLKIIQLTLPVTCPPLKVSASPLQSSQTDSSQSILSLYLAVPILAKPTLNTQIEF